MGLGFRVGLTWDLFYLQFYGLYLLTKGSDYSSLGK